MMRKAGAGGGGARRRESPLRKGGALVRATHPSEKVVQSRACMPAWGIIGTLAAAEPIPYLPAHDKFLNMYVTKLIRKPPPGAYPTYPLTKKSVTFVTVTSRYKSAQRVVVGDEPIADAKNLGWTAGRPLEPWPPGVASRPFDGISSH